MSRTVYKARAFTLIELVVSIGIISLVSAVVFFNFPQFNESVALNRAARELTLILREAQTRAISVTPLPDGVTFPNNYGVYIKEAPNAEGNGEFILFSDDDDDLLYDPGTDPMIKTVTFTRGVQITGFAFPGGVSVPGGAHFIFYRPGPKVIVSDGVGACVAGESGDGNGQNNKCLSASGAYGPFLINISRPASPTPLPPRTIEIWRTGQISIK